eukprot:g11727.t1
MDKALFASAFLCSSTLGAAHAGVDNGTAYLHVHAAGNNSTISRTSRRTTLSSEREVLSKSRSAPDSSTDVLPLLLVDPDRISAEAGASISSMLTTTGEYPHPKAAFPPVSSLAASWCNPGLGCPAGTEAVAYDGNYLGADIGGCGLTDCIGSVNTYDSIEACRDACEQHAGCKGITFAPKNGDANWDNAKVCLLYKFDTPTSRWPGGDGQYHQLFCKMNQQCAIGEFAYGTLKSDGRATKADHNPFAFDDFGNGPVAIWNDETGLACHYNPGRTWCRMACDRAAHCTHYAHGESLNTHHCMLFNSCRVAAPGEATKDTTGRWLEENTAPKVYKCFGRCNGVVTCSSPNYRKRKNYDAIVCSLPPCSLDECCIQTCQEPQNKVGYANPTIAYDQVRGWIYPDETAMDFESLSGLHKCDDDWLGSPEFRCQGPGKVLEMTGCSRRKCSDVMNQQCDDSGSVWDVNKQNVPCGTEAQCKSGNTCCTPVPRFKCSDVVHGDENCAEADPESVRDENKKNDDCGTSQADCKSGQICCRKRKCSDVVLAHTDSADDANNAYIGEDTAALLTLGSNHPVHNNPLNFHENFSLLYCNHDNGFGGHPHFKCQGPGEQLQVLHCKRATCGAQYNAEKASASAFACDSDYMQRPGYADINCKEGKCTRDECCARQCQAPASSVDAYKFRPEDMATMLKHPQSFPGSSAWTPDSSILACDGDSGFVGQSPTVQCEAENAPLTLAGCSQRFCGTSDPGQTPFACSPDYRKKNNYDEIECETQACSRDECCIQTCQEPLDKDGYSVADNFAGDEHTAYRQLLDHVEMYPDLASEFTSQPGVGVFKCDHGWHGTPKFRCPGPGQVLNMTGCFDNCRPHVVPGSKTCSNRGYGPATSAAVGRSDATGYEPADYSMKTHERALATDDESLTAEECCTRGTRCGGLFMLESEFHASRVDNLMAYAEEPAKGRNWCKTVHKYGNPRGVQTKVPRDKAMCCRKPTCAEAFFGRGNQCPAFTEGFLQSADVRNDDVRNHCATYDCSADEASNVVACCKRRRVCPYDADTKDELGIFSAAIGRKLGKYFNIRQTAVLTNENASGAFSCKGFASPLHGLTSLTHLSTEPRMDFCQGQTCSRDLDVAACCRNYVEQENYMFCNSFQTPRFYVNEEAARQACNYDFPRHACLGYQEDGNVYNSETARLFLNTSLSNRVRKALDLDANPTLYGNWSLLLTPKWLDSNCTTAPADDSRPAECNSSHGELAQCVDLTTLAVDATRRRQELADLGLSPEEAPAPANTHQSPEGFINVARFDPGNLLTNSANRASKNRVFLKNRTQNHNSSFTIEDLGVNLSLLFPYSNMDAASAKASAKRAGQSSMKTRLILPEESVETLKQSERRILEQAEFDGAAGEGEEENPTTVTAATGNGELSAVTMRRAMAAALNSYAETAPEPDEGNEHEGITEADGTTTSTASTTTAGPTDASSYISKSPAAALQNETQDAETEAVAPTQRGQLLQLGGRDGAEKLGRRGRATSDRTSKDINVLDSSTAMSPPFAFVVDIDATSATGEIPETDLAQMLNTSGAAAEVLRKQLAEKILKEQHARGLSSLTLDGISVSIESVSPNLPGLGEHTPLLSKGPLSQARL